MSEQATITLTMIDSPSRSKMAGPCWIAACPEGQEPVYATEKGRSLTAEVGSLLKVRGKAELRKAAGGKHPTIRGEWTVRVTGEAADTVTVHCGLGQQYVSVKISGVVSNPES